MIKSELYFGMSIPNNGGFITARQFQKFIDEVVTPLFPNGLTVIEAKGQWHEETGLLAREPARILILVHEGPEVNGDQASITDIRSAYCEQFEQEAVMLLQSQVNAYF